VVSVELLSGRHNEGAVRKVPESFEAPAIPNCGKEILPV
jgi:hypothetical protein